MTARPIEAALAALHAGDRATALAILRAAGPNLSDDPIALQAWSLTLSMPEQLAEAHALSARALRLNPGDANAHFNVGVHLVDQGDLAGAIARYEQALALHPTHSGALNNLSDLYRRRGRADDGWALMQRYFANGGSNRGMALRMAKLALDTRRFDEAQTWFVAAAAEQPGSPLVMFEHAMLTLLREDFANGWPQYEARFEMYGLPGLAIYPYPLPQWDGAARQRVLVHREQGLGDMMMFAAAVPGMIDDGVDVHLAMAPSLQRLFAASFPKAKVWPSVTIAQAVEQPAQKFLAVCGPLDSQIAMCGLGAARMAAGPPPPAPYLRAPDDVRTAWRARLDALAPRRAGERRIGLCFAARKPTFSDDGMTNGIRKSLVPADLAGLADIANVRWFSLHDASTAGLFADARLPVTDLSPWISDFADTAGIIAEMDLVISVDTAVAHLAGAMGAPLWLLLWRNADWRWGVDRNDALWYRNVMTFRQHRAGDWADVISRVTAALDR
jgi:Flp pilus assembly protein TadD